MRSVLVGSTCVILALAGWRTVNWTGHQDESSARRRMSFHNRLLLNRAAVSGLESVEVMLLAARTQPSDMEAIQERVRARGGRIRRANDTVGYLRAEIPIAKLTELVSTASVASYQIASLSRGSWYRDGPPMANAQMFRGLEVAPPGAAARDNHDTALPALPPAVSHASGYTGDDEVGVAAWLREHPTFDGRGVTIALLESAQPSFLDPTLGSALTLDGRPVPKLAGILNTIDPEQPDTTRVVLDSEVHATTGWVRIGARTYVVPRPGRFTFGVFTLPAGSNLVHQFGVLADERSGDVWVDANGNADFRDEPPVADVNERFDPRILRLTHPRPLGLSFVVGKGRTPRTVHVYAALGSHQAMTLSVAAGSRTHEGLAFGVAPNARVLLVRNTSGGYRLADFVESYLEASAHPAVDIVNASAAFTMVPDTAADFMGLFFERAMAAYGKPIIDAAGNRSLWLNSASSRASILSVGGSMGPKAFAALYGGGTLDGTIVHPSGAAGPSLDGAIKPDFLAPMERLAADLPWLRGAGTVPATAPAFAVPAGYQISCCTSASSPYAAGVAALLISGARQRSIPWSLASLTRAMRVGARFLPGFQSHEQGHGVLNVHGAWQELTSPVEIPRIIATADVVHPLASYGAKGPEGQGILEFRGWAAGMHGRRDIRLRRESGPLHPVTYRLSWTGSDGTFSSPTRVVLPRDHTVAVPVTIDVTRPGARSALLNVHDPDRDRIVFRAQATIVAAERIDPASGTVRIDGTVGLMKTTAHYVEVPAGARVLGIQLEVTGGAVRAAILPGHGLHPSYYHHVHPGTTRLFAKGVYNANLPNPVAGTWGIYLTNDSLSTPVDTANASGERAAYSVTVQIRQASLKVARHGDDVAVEVQNVASAIEEPVVEVSPATLRTHRGQSLESGLPTLIDIAVPPGASTLALQLNSAPDRPVGLELHLYDCTSGECFSYDLAFPAARSRRLVVRQPAEGRWVAAVNTAPFPSAGGSFVLEEIIVTGGTRRSSGSRSAQPAGARWSETVAAVAPVPAAGGRTPILFAELIDLAVERVESARSWDPRPIATKLRNQPVAIGTDIHVIK